MDKITIPKKQKNGRQGEHSSAGEKRSKMILKSDLSDDDSAEAQRKREIYQKRIANLTGRPKGVPNKVTTAFKDTVRMLLEDNAENVSEWLSRVAEKDPARALDLLSKLAEYAAPKLSRVEVAGDKDNPLEVRTITRNIVDPLVLNRDLKEIKEIKNIS